MTPTYDSVKAFLSQQGYILERGEGYSPFVVRKPWPDRYCKSYKTLTGVLRSHGGVWLWERWAINEWNKQQEATA
jgi:hypothetical protein